MKGNSIPVCRSILDHWVYKDAEYFKAWFEMLARAKYTEGERTDMYNGTLYTIKRGEFIFGYPSWSERLNIGQQKLRTLIKKLIQSEMITLVKHYSKFTVYYINNYSKFNNQDNNLVTVGNKGLEDIDNKQNNNQVTSNQQSDNKQITTNKEGKESKEGIIVLGVDEERFINALKTIKNYPLDLAKDRELYLKLSEKYPSLDLVKAAEEWAIYKLDTPLKANSNPRSQFNTSCSNAVKWGKCTKQKVAVGQTAKVVMFNFDED